MIVTFSLRRYRWWVLLAGAVMFVVLVRVVYFALLPAEGWLTRGWYAMRDRRYDIALTCFRNAQRNDPQSDLPRLALNSVARIHTVHPLSRFAPFAAIPFLGDRLVAWDALMRERRFARITANPVWMEATYGPFGASNVPPVIFAGYWGVSSRATTLLFTAMRATAQGQFARAWHAFRQLERDSPSAFTYFRQSSGYVYRYYAYAAVYSGHPRDAERILLTLHLPGQPCDLALLHNLRMGFTDGPPAEAWEFIGSLQRSDFAWSISRSPLMLAPGRDGAHLLPATLADTGQHWWQWDGHWRERAKQDRRQLAGMARTLFSRSLRDETSQHETKLATLDCAWTTNAEFLIFNRFYDRQTYHGLWRIDHGVTPLSGYDAEQVLGAGSDLWVRGMLDVTRIAANDEVSEYRGRRGQAIGEIFTRPRPLPRPGVALDPHWTLARDGAERLWLVRWDGHELALRATWEQETFRAPTPSETARARGGFVDSAGRLWRPDELPAGFRRDGWRHARGLPAFTGPAVYAVDGRRRVWVVRGGVAACWDGRWRSVAHRLPSLQPQFVTVVAAGDGVLIALPAQVCALQ